MEDRLRRIEAREPVACGLSPEPGLGWPRSPPRAGLTHRVRIAIGVVSEYRIEAPTARRFAAGGEAETLLARCGDAMQARWAMHAIDPCVCWVVEAA
jgi:hypothetical protein